MITIEDENGKVVSKSKNLQGILRTASKQGVQEIVVKPMGTAARLSIQFYGGLYAQTEFESFKVCERWIRRPLFAGAAVHIG